MQSVVMGVEEIPSARATATATNTASGNAAKVKKLTLIPLIFLIYFEVAGGPYGEEPAVQAAGPLLALLGFLIFPFIWSVPEALITAELTTAYPGNGGVVLWVERAFGPFWGSLMGTWKFLSGVIDIASFPVLCIEYVQKIFPVLRSGWPRQVAVIASTLALSFLNYTGLTIVGNVAVLLAVVSLSPFVLMSLIAIPKIKPHRWVSLGQKGVKKDWNLFFNTLFWNLNFWDNVSTLAGEVDKPNKTFPLALFVAVIFTCVSYLIPLFAVTGAVSVDQNQWETGFHAQAAEIIAGKWLKIWIEVGAVLSAIGLFEAHLSSSAYQVLGMAEIGILPKFFGVRSKWFNTPCLGMLLEFASFLWLRWKSPSIERPYRVPLKLQLLAVMCFISSGFLVFIMVIATKTVYLVSGVMTVAGIGFFLFIKVCKTKKWVDFSLEEQKETPLKRMCFDGIKIQV
ncbi:probable polyamine transporter At3g13620 [Vigna radiata var. radiata]|uniref:Probable polyamine transporter At3g13620 n=1 Tax=Vigna radiata var. radiata TaxID=3916 RepID=A0A3Q0EQ01_VIGRR|nr:probable polyamine transporter At3g13620 [Vigna radiata var. radiata]